MMNHAEVIEKVSVLSGVDAADCTKVLKAFEQVLEDELSNSKKIGNAFDKIYKLLHYFKNK